MSQAITKFIHDVLSSPAVQLGGHQVESMVQAKAWLRDVNSGKLVVSNKAVEEAVKEAITPTSKE